MAEKWDAYDRFRNKIGFEITRGEPLPEGVRHLVVIMIYWNSRGELLIQRRSDTKKLWPGIWAFTGGSALSGETSAQACVRETEEELGFTPDMSQSELIISYMTREDFTDVYLIRADVETEEMKLQTEEVSETSWLSKEEFCNFVTQSRNFGYYPCTDMIVRYINDCGYIK